MSDDSLDSVFIHDDHKHVEKPSKYKHVDRYTVRKDESLNLLYKAPEKYRKKYCSLSEKVDATKTGYTRRLRHHSAEEYDELLARRRIYKNVSKLEKLQRDFDVTETLTKVLNDSIANDALNYDTDIDLTKCIERDANLYKTTKLYTDVEYEIYEAVSVIERIGSCSTDWRKSVVVYTEADKINFAIKTAFEMEELNVKKNRFLFTRLRNSCQKTKRKHGTPTSPKSKKKVAVKNGRGSKRIWMARYIWNIFHRKPSQGVISASKKSNSVLKEANANTSTQVPERNSLELQKEQEQLHYTGRKKEENIAVKENLQVTVEVDETKEKNEYAFDTSTKEGPGNIVFKIKRIAYFSSTVKNNVNINLIPDADDNNEGDCNLLTETNEYSIDNADVTSTIVKETLLEHSLADDFDKDVIVSLLNANDNSECCPRKSVEFNDQPIEWSPDVSSFDREFNYDDNDDENQIGSCDGENNNQYNKLSGEDAVVQMKDIDKNVDQHELQVKENTSLDEVDPPTDISSVLGHEIVLSNSGETTVKKPSKIRSFWKRILRRKIMENKSCDNGDDFTHSQPDEKEENVELSISTPTKRSVNLRRTSTRLSQVLITTLSCDASDLSSLLDFAESIIKPEYDSDHTESDVALNVKDIIKSDDENTITP